MDPIAIVSSAAVVLVIFSAWMVGQLVLNRIADRRLESAWLVKAKEESSGVLISGSAIANNQSVGVMAGNGPNSGHRFGAGGGAPSFGVGLPAGVCVYCGQLPSGHAGPHAQGRADQAHMDEEARTNPAGWILARLRPYVPNELGAPTSAWIELAQAANVFLDQIDAMPNERHLLLPEGVGPLDMRKLGQAQGTFRMVDGVGVKIEDGETTLRLRWHTDEIDPYVITLSGFR